MLADAPTAQLRDVMVATGLLVHCRAVFMQRITGNPAHDPLRSLIISLLQVPRSFPWHSVPSGLLLHLRVREKSGRYMPRGLLESRSTMQVQ